MGKIAEATFKGASGEKYSFNVYSLDTEFNNIGAVYIFTKRTTEQDKGSHTFLYIGQTSELGDRIAQHEKWPCVRKYDANCICAHADEDEDSRLAKEADLLKANKPSCND
jgi:predicted GIY-YIG superfamily endonuclease